MQCGRSPAPLLMAASGIFGPGWGRRQLAAPQRCQARTLTPIVVAAHGTVLTPGELRCRALRATGSGLDTALARPLTTSTRRALLRLRHTLARCRSLPLEWTRRHSEKLSRLPSGSSSVGSSVPDRGTTQRAALAGAPGCRERERQLGDRFASSEAAQRGSGSAHLSSRLCDAGGFCGAARWHRFKWAACARSRRRRSRAAAPLVTEPARRYQRGAEARRTVQAAALQQMGTTAQAGTRQQAPPAPPPAPPRAPTLSGARASGRRCGRASCTR